MQAHQGLLSPLVVPNPFPLQRENHMPWARDGPGRPQAAPDGPGRPQTAPDGPGRSRTTPDGPWRAKTSPDGPRGSGTLICNICVWAPAPSNAIRVVFGGQPQKKHFFSKETFFKSASKNSFFIACWSSGAGKCNPSNCFEALGLKNATPPAVFKPWGRKLQPLLLF